MFLPGHCFPHISQKHDYVKFPLGVNECVNMDVHMFSCDVIHRMYSQDGLRFHHNPDQDNLLTKDESMIWIQQNRCVALRKQSVQLSLLSMCYLVIAKILPAFEKPLAYLVLECFLYVWSIYQANWLLDGVQGLLVLCFMLLLQLMSAAFYVLCSLLCCTGCWELGVYLRIMQ